MNIFSRKDGKSDPHVSILLDDECRAPFRPGSRIAGTTTLESPNQRQVHLAEAIFFGRVITHCTRLESMGTTYHRTAYFSTNETVKYHDDACLFRFRQKLCEPLVVEPSRRYTWRFDFTFPHAASLVGPSPYVGPTEFSGTYISSRHLLPPTFARYFNENHYAIVEYSIQAVFQLSDNAEPLIIQLPSLEFSPIHRPPDPSSLVEFVRPLEKFSSSRLMDKHKSFRLSLRDKVSSATPSVDILMKTSLNTQVVRSSVLPIHSCVEIENNSVPLTSIPSVHIRIKSLKLCQITIFRARVYKGAATQTEYQEMGDYTIVLSAQPDHCTVESQMKPKEAGNCMFFPTTFEARIPDEVRPSFRTFNINHNSQLRVTLEAEVLGKTFEHKFVVENLNVLPS